MESFTIRFAKEGDLNELLVLCELHAIYEKTPYDKLNKAKQLNKHLFADIPSLYCIVVEKDKKLIGYATYMKQFSTWDADHYIYMDCLFLMEDARGLGIGELLVKRIQKEAHQLQCSCIQWQTPDFNKRAIKFYHRIGASSKTKERFFLSV